MKQPTRADVPRIKRLIESTPKDGLPELLVTIVRCCVHKGIYPGRTIKDVVDTIEKQFRGKPIQPE